MSVGSGLRRIREARGMSQREVGELAGLKASYVCRIETGRIQPTTTTLGRLADALEVPVADVFVSDEELPVPGHSCPVSSSGECVGRLIREGGNDRACGAKKGRKPTYSEEELRLLRITDHLIRHGLAEVRRTLKVLLEALMSRSREHSSRS